MQVAIMTANAQIGDAIGNQVAEKLAFFLDRGAQVRVFAESWQALHPFVQPYCQRANPREPSGESWDYLSRADVLVVEFSHFYPLLGLLPLLAGSKPRVLFDYHGITPAHLWEPQHRERIELAAQQRGLVWCADLTVTHSRFTRRELWAHCGFPLDRCRRLPLPIDTHLFCPGSAARSLRTQLGLADAFLLLFVGRLAVNKRVGMLVEALARLREQTPPVHAVVVGDTADLYQLEMRRCQNRASELGVADRFHFLGHVDDARLRDAYRSANAFVMPSVHEGFCLPVLEAMACGLPVVAARAAALPETIGNAGLTFTPDDPDDLARQLRRLLPAEEPVRQRARKTRRQGDSDSPVALAERLRRRGLERAAAHARPVWRERFAAVVEDLLDHPARPHREQVEVHPRTPSRTVSAAAGTIVVPVRVRNQGTHPVLACGPGRVTLRAEVIDTDGHRFLSAQTETPLPSMLMPAHEAATLVPVEVPATPGTYQVTFRAAPSACHGQQNPSVGGSKALRLIVESASRPAPHGCCADLLAEAQTALVEAHSRRQLPDNFLDVTKGWLASWKAWLKRKLLGNFKHAYVDVLSRQQSAFNQQVLTALQELTECCALLDSKWGLGDSSLAAFVEQMLAMRTSESLATLLRELLDQVAEDRRELQALRERIVKLEQQAPRMRFHGSAPAPEGRL
jgi:glycosyltransferase involved in cell wall biosynthesis